MASEESKVLTGEALKPCADDVLNLAMQLAQYNGGNLSAAVFDVLNAIARLNEALAAPHPCIPNYGLTASEVLAQAGLLSGAGDSPVSLVEPQELPPVASAPKVLAGCST